MAMSHHRADETLDQALTGATPYVWLHIGNPGAEGDNNIAQDSGGNIDRKTVTFGSPESHETNDERRVLNTSEVEWTGEEIDDSQEVSYFSVWSEAEGGAGEQPEFIAPVTTAKVIGSDGVIISEGDLEIAIEVYEKPAE